MKERLLAAVLALLERAVGVPQAALCRFCGRRLTSPKSIEAGAGACCLRGRSRDTRTIDMFDTQEVAGG